MEEGSKTHNNRYKEELFEKGEEQTHFAPSSCNTNLLTLRGHIIGIRNGINLMLKDENCPEINISFDVPKGQMTLLPTFKYNAKLSSGLLSLR
ncbi:hypothetical protein CHS0354_040531 [Potamilus streckersoni]|uniref:Uncharacterized protein n=1 Tax=Potamilus streckersoni TaxID=2493646 RepID=A0AAE0T2E6_9BIVA|nr:hypothetical protein CHS0354_040531 [Potamilus streckersoni]